jgi:hypothetical protein
VPFEPIGNETAIPVGGINCILAENEIRLVLVK